LSQFGLTPFEERYFHSYNDMFFKKKKIFIPRVLLIQKEFKDYGF